MAKNNAEEYYYEQPSNWSFARYFKSIAHFKWWVIGFTVAGALGGYLGFRFILNPMKKNATITYAYNLAGEDNEDGTVRFIDGSTFSVYDLTTKDVVEKVRASKEEYANVDTNGLIKNGLIKVSRSVGYYDKAETQ